MLPVEEQAIKKGIKEGEQLLKVLRVDIEKAKSAGLVVTDREKAYQTEKDKILKLKAVYG